MSVPTLEEIEHWPPPNYVNPSTRVPALIGVMLSSTIAMLPFLIARIHLRRSLKGRLGVDDWIIISAAILSIASTVLAIYGTKFGAGYHLWDIRPQWVPTFRKIGVAGSVIFTVAVTLPKTSVCFTYPTLFVSRVNTIFSYSMVAFLTCYWIATVCVTIFQCRPIQSYWDSSVASEYCVNADDFNMITAGLNTLSDFLVYLWPIQYLWNIQLAFKKKIGVIFLFIIGCGACVAGVSRMYYIHKTLTGYEYFYDGAAIWLSSSVEINVGIVFTCMHTTRPILARIFPGFFSSTPVYSKGRRYQYQNEHPTPYFSQNRANTHFRSLSRDSKLDGSSLGLHVVSNDASMSGKTEAQVTPIYITNKVG